MLFTPIEVGGPTNPVGVVITFVTFLLNLLGMGGVDLSVLTTAVNNTWANLVYTTAFLYNSIGYLTNFIKKFLLILLDGLKHILTDIIHGKLRQILQDLRNMFKALHDLFAPILKFLDSVRAFYYKYIFKWIVMVQDLLSRIRVILTLFRLLGSKWAAKLDADMARIQGYITQATSLFVSTLNQAITWLNIMVDPAGILRRDFFTGTLFSSLTAVKNAALFGNDRMLTASEMQHEVDDKALLTSPTGILTRNADGSVTYSDAAKRMNGNFDAAMNYYGQPVALH
jgi:hypothetical protein